MHRFIHYIKTGCIIYTVVVLLNAASWWINNKANIRVSTLFQILAMVVLVQCLIYFTDKLHIKNGALSIAVQLFDAVITIMVCNLIFKWFEYVLFNILSVVIIIAVTYLITYGINVMKINNDASKINKRIKHIKESSK